jgi:hypothetical protein
MIFVKTQAQQDAPIQDQAYVNVYSVGFEIGRKKYFCGG